ncbi:MAG: hypothetical protein R3C11_18560 [Planctomycetaceae bacterium]
MTESLEECWKLSHWVKITRKTHRNMEAVVKEVAGMPPCCMILGVHRSYYLGHLMLAKNTSPRKIHVIDLGRVLAYCLASLDR